MGNKHLTHLLNRPLYVYLPNTTVAAFDSSLVTDGKDITSKNGLTLSPKRIK